MITPNSYKAQQEGRPYQPQPNADRMQGSEDQQQGQQQTQQQWTGTQQGTSGPQYQGQSGNQYPGQSVQQYQGQPYPQGYPEPPMQPNTPQGKSKVVAALLAFFLTSFGAANFYLGYKKTAFIQLGLFIAGAVLMIISAILTAAIGENLSDVVNLFTSIIPRCIFTALEIWALVDFIRVLTKTAPMDRDVNGIPLN